MIGISKCLNAYTMHIVNVTPVKNLLRYIFKMGVNNKFDFRRVWKFCWDLSNAISGGNWLFRWDCVFPGGTLYPSANYDNLYSFIQHLQTFTFHHLPSLKEDLSTFSNNMHLCHYLPVQLSRLLLSRFIIIIINSVFKVDKNLQFFYSF